MTEPVISIPLVLPGTSYSITSVQHIPQKMKGSYSITMLQTTSETTKSGLVMRMQ
jgi:hypothetical protein